MNLVIVDVASTAHLAPSEDPIQISGNRILLSQRSPAVPRRPPVPSFTPPPTKVAENVPCERKSFSADDKGTSFSFFSVHANVVMQTTDFIIRPIYIVSHNNVKPCFRLYIMAFLERFLPF